MERTRTALFGESIYVFADFTVINQCEYGIVWKGGRSYFWSGLFYTPVCSAAAAADVH